MMPLKRKQADPFGLILFSLLAALAAIGLAFAVWPNIDVIVARAFFNGHEFPAAHDGLWRVCRRVMYWIPTLILVISALIFLSRGLRGPRRNASIRALIFLFATLAIGPGLLVNVVLKAHSHRPRPSQIVQFGGSETFRPWEKFDGACRSNCSFASGEASAAFWTAAPALLVPPPFHAVAMASALLFGLSVSVLRIAFGGHFLSDTVLSALLTLIVIFALAKILGLRAPASGSESDAE